MQGRPVSRVRLKHLLDQIPQLVGQVTGEGRVRTPTHLQYQALPAGSLELEAELDVRITGTTNNAAICEP